MSGIRNIIMIQFYKKSEFPLQRLENSMNKDLCSNVSKQKENDQAPLLESSNKRFYKIPYTDNVSIQT